MSEEIVLCATKSILCEMALIIKCILELKGEMVMVFCTNCGAANDETAAYCVKCGTNLDVSKRDSWDRRMERWGEDFGKRAEEWGEDFGRQAEAWGEDFGRQADKELSNIGVIFGLLIGVIMVLVGITWIAGIELTQYFWALIIIVFGLLVLAGSIYGLKQRP